MNDRLYRVVTNNNGLQWTGDDEQEAEYQALSIAITTGYTTYVVEGNKPFAMRVTV